jgi:DNA invertase Pin-like site-specific DNA recombinase
MKVALYIRVSTEDQAENGLSLAEQEERLRHYCALHSLEPLDPIRDEGVSAEKPLLDRPKGRDLIKLVKQRQIKAIVSTKLDRLFRSTIDCLTTVEIWDKTDVGLRLIDFGGQSIDTKSAMGRMFLTMAAGFAEFERRLTGERTAAVMRRKASRGEYCGGDAPYGYIRNGSIIIECPDEQKVIIRARELKSTGLGSKRIAAKLMEEGFKPRSGREFFPVQIDRMLKQRIAA